MQDGGKEDEEKDLVLRVLIKMYKWPFCITSASISAKAVLLRLYPLDSHMKTALAPSALNSSQ